MGLPLMRTLVLLAILPAVPVRAALPAQAAGRTGTPAAGRFDWMQQRMGGDLGPDFSLRLSQEAQKVRAGQLAGSDALPSAATPPASGVLPSGAGVGGANGTSWVNLGPANGAFIQQAPVSPLGTIQVGVNNAGITLKKVNSGRVQAILPDPADATGNTVYVLAAGGGLWKTTSFLNATPNWVPKTDLVGAGATYGAAALGRSSGTIHLGMGDAFDVGVGGYMLRSTNGGDTWSGPVQLGSATRVLAVEVDTTGAADVVLVGTNVGLFRSTDGGATYTQASTLNSWVWSLARTSAGWLAAQEYGGIWGSGQIFLSTDQGATWGPIPNTGRVYLDMGRTTLAVGAPGDAVVYAFASAEQMGGYVWDQAQGDVFLSVDGGLTWFANGLNMLATGYTYEWLGTMGGYSRAIAVSPADPTRNTLFVGGESYYFGRSIYATSTNGGWDWTTVADSTPGMWSPVPAASEPGDIGLPYVGGFPHCAATSTFGGVTRIYIGTDQGLFTSIDGGVTWDDTKNRGLVTFEVNSLSSNQASPDSVLAGFHNNGTRVREGATSTFDRVQSGQWVETATDFSMYDGQGVGLSQANNNASLCSASYGYIWRSTRNPVVDRLDWKLIPIGVDADFAVFRVGPFTWYYYTPIIAPAASADPSGQVFFTYTGSSNSTDFSNSIYRNDAGAWKQIFRGGSRGSTSWYDSVRPVPHGLGVSPTDLDHVAAAGNDGKLFLTRTGGVVWDPIYLGEAPTLPGKIPGWRGFNASVAWASDSVLYVSSEAPAAGAARVGRSADGGLTWARADGGLPDVPVTKLAVDPGDVTGSTVYAATWLGLYRTTDGGANWERFGTGLPLMRVSDVWVAPNSSAIRVATAGRGIWELASHFTAGTVSVGPAFTTLYAGQTQRFAAAIYGAGGFAPGAVTWTASGGTVDASGLYTAAGTPGTFSVTATSAADGTKSATATVIVRVPAIRGVTLTPASATLLSGGRRTFLATVAGGPDTSVVWSSSLPGAVDAAGVFTAPNTIGTHTVTATSHQDATRSATATIHVAPSGELLVNPGFEQSDGVVEGWVVSDPTFLHHGATARLTVGSHGGNNWLQLGGKGVAHLDTVAQPVFLPTTLSGATLSLWVKIGSDDSSATAHDTLAVQIRDAGGAVLETLGTLSNRDRSGPASGAGTVWQQKTYALNLAAYRGQAVQVYVEGTEDSSLATRFELDDFSLTASTPLSVAHDLDLNHDGSVDVNDLLNFARDYGTNNPESDFDGDHFVTDLDLLLLLGAL